MIRGFESHRRLCRKARPYVRCFQVREPADKDFHIEQGHSYRRYLEPKVLAKIGALELRARLIVEGYFMGMHRSPFRGVSIEFADHRVYTQGDDIRHIDWKLFGRTDKYYIKEFEQETNLQCVFLVDCSESMSYGSDPQGLNKHDYAISIAAALSYLALRQGDAAGLALFDRKLTHFLRPSSNPAQWKTIIQELTGKTGPTKTSIKSVLDDLAERLKRRTLIILISDLFDDPAEIMKGLHHLRYRRHEVIVCAVWDHAERTFPFQGPTLFEGLESAGKLLADARSLRSGYLREMERFAEQLQRGCRQMHIDYTPFDTAAPLDVAISAYLATRSTSLTEKTARS